MRSMINSLLDPVVNFGKVTVSTGYTSEDATIDLIPGDGSKLPNPDTNGQFNLVWFNNSTYSDPADDPYVEIVRCTVRTDDVLTVTRHQEGTIASNKNIPGRTYKMLLSPTKKTIDDIQTESQSKVNAHSALSTGVHGMGTDTIDGVGTRNIAISTHSSTTSSVHGFDVLGDAPAQIHDSSRHTGTIGNHTTNLSNVGSNTHAQIDTAITASNGHIAASGTSVHGLGTISTQAANNVTITGGTITAITDLAVADGGTGRDSAVAYAPICGGTTDTMPQQSVASVGSTGQVLTSNGAGALPTFQTQTVPVKASYSEIDVGTDDAKFTTANAIANSAISTATKTQTLTNKRITARVQSVSNAATITPSADNDDAVDITAIAQTFTIANPTGTPTNFQKLLIRIKDNGTARAITWGTAYAAQGISLPSTTVLSKILTIGFIYNTANSLNKWQLVALAQEA